MKRKLLLYLCLATLTQCSKCKRDDPAPQPPKDPLSTLPPESQTGSGNVGCLVNGKAFIGASPTLVRGDRQSLTRFTLGNGLKLNGQVGSEQINLPLIIEGNLADNQAFFIISSASPFPVFTPGVNQFITIVVGDNICSYSGACFKSGKVDLVKFDPVVRIASGRFAFKLYEPGGCDTLRVTNGRFDVKF